MFIQPIPFVRRDGNTFEIDVVNLENVGYVCRIWKNGVVVNNPKDKAFTDPDDAFNHGMQYCKEWKSK